MHVLVTVTIIVALSVPFLASLGFAPEVASHLPELMGMIAAGIVVVLGAGNRFKYVRPAYWLVFGALTLLIVCGVIVNSLQPGPLVAGLRQYLRAIPFFLLPAVLLLRDRQLKVQLLVLLVLCVLQLPIAWEQRMSDIARGSPTGDNTFGTLMNAKWLTLFLVSAAAVLTAFFLRRQVRAWVYFPVLAAILVPTMINESKGTIILLPIALLVVFIVGASPGRRLKNSLVAVLVITCFAAVFVPVYDHFMEPRWGERSIVDFFSDRDEVTGYLNRQHDLGTFQPGQRAGKVDGIVVSLRELSNDPTTLFFGLGIGNASASALGRQFTGEHHRLYGPLLTNSMVSIMLELGLAGLALVLLLYWLIWRDTLQVAKSDPGIMGTLAIGWTGVVLVMALGIAYHSPHESRAMSVLFWYFSGLVAAHRMRRLHAESSVDMRRAHGLAGAGPSSAIGSAHGQGGMPGAPPGVVATASSSHRSL